MPTEIAKLAAELLHDPVQVSVTPVAKTADRVNQQVLFVETHRKRDVLVELLADAAMARTIVFTRTKRGADKVTQHLDGAGIAAVAIHGNKSQSQRERSLAAFKAGRVRALVATDIAARGIDIDNVTHVVNFDLPEVRRSLCAPDRAHRPRGRGRRRHFALRRRRAGPAAQHRTADAKQSADAGPARRAGLARIEAARARGGAGEAPSGPAAA